MNYENEIVSNTLFWECFKLKVVHLLNTWYLNFYLQNLIIVSFPGGFLFSNHVIVLSEPSDHSTSLSSAKSINHEPVDGECILKPKCQYPHFHVSTASKATNEIMIFVPWKKSRGNLSKCLSPCSRFSFPFLILQTSF